MSEGNEQYPDIRERMGIIIAILVSVLALLNEMGII